MEVTISLPDKIFANISSVANKSKRRVDEIIAEKIENEFSINIEDLEKQIIFCSDKELLELGKLQMPTKQDNCLRNLLHKQNEEDLTKSEQKELWKLMELNRLTTLKKAFALREISRRNLNGKD